MFTAWYRTAKKVTARATKPADDVLIYTERFHPVLLFQHELHNLFNYMFLVGNQAVFQTRQRERKFGFPVTDEINSIINFFVTGKKKTHTHPHSQT